MSTRRSLLERADHLRHYREHFTVIFGETGSPAALLPGSVPRPVVQRLGAAAAATPAPAAPLRVTARLKYPAEAELLAEAEAFGVPSGMPATAWTGNGEVVAEANPAALPQTHWTQTHESQLHEPQPNLTPSDLAALSVATPSPAAPPHWQSPPLPPLDERQVAWVDPGRPALYAQPDIQPPPPVWPSEPMSQPPPERSTQTGQLSFRELMTFTGAAATGSAPFVSPPVDPSAAFQSESGSTAPGVGQLENGESNLTPPANLTQSSAAGLETVQANAAPTGPSQPSAALPGDVPLLAQDTGQTRETPPIVSGANASSTQAAAAWPGQLGPAPTLAAPQAQALASEVQQPLPLGAEPDRAPDARQEESDSVAPAELVLPTEQPQPTISLGAASANAAALLNTATTFSEALATADPQSAPSSTATAAVTPGPERQTATPEPAPQPIAASVSTSETSGPMDAVAARPAQPAMTERMATSETQMTTQIATNDLPNSASQAPKAEHAAPAPSARALAPEQRQSAPATPARLDTASSAPEQQADEPALAAPPSAPAQGQPALSAPASETALPAQPPSALNPAPSVSPASDGVEPERAANVMPSMQEAQAFSADNPAVPAQEQDAVSAPASEQPRSETESSIAAAQSLAADAPLTPVQAAQPAASLSVTPAPQPASSDTAAEQDTGPALIDRPAGFVPMGDDPETVRKLREHLPPSHPGVGLKLPRRPRPVALQPSVPKEDPAAAIPVQSPEQVRSVLERLNRVIEAEGEEGGDARPMSLAEILSWQRPATAASAAPEAAQVGPETGIMQAATPNVNPPNLNPEPRAVQNASSLQPGSLQPSSLQPSQFAALPTPPESAPALPAEQTADLSASPLPSGNLGQASQSAAPEGQTELSELASVPHPGALSTQQTDARQVQLRPTAPDSGSSPGAPLEPQVRPLDSGPPQPRPLNFPGAPVPGANAALSRAQPNRGVGNPPLPSVQSQNTAQIISSRLPARSMPPEQKAKGQTEQRPLTVQSAVEQGSVPSVNLAPQTNAASQTPSAESPAQPQFTAPLSPSAASAAPRSLSASPAAQPSPTQPLSASPLATPPWSAGDQAHQTAPGINLAPPQINAAPGAYGSEARTGLEAALPVSPAPAPEAPRSLSALTAAQATPPGANSPAPTAERVFGSSPSPAVPSVPAVQTDAAPGQQVNAPQAMSKPASTPNLPVSPPDQSLPLSAASGLGNEMASAQIHSDQVHSDQMNAGQVRQQLASPAQTSQAPSIQSSVPDLHILDSQPENAAQVRAERRQSDTVESSPAVQQPPMTAATALGQALRTRPEDGATSQADAQPPAITSPSDAEPAPEVPAPKAVARPLFKPNWSGQPKSAAQPANPQPGAKDGQFAPKAGGDAGAVAANPRPMTATSPQRPMTQAQQRLEQALASPQAREPLPLSVRSRLTPLLGQDPGEVHLIRNAHATAATAAAAADALTVGDAVLLSPGQDLASPRGLGLLAHELTHVLRGRDPGFVPALVRRVPGRPEVLAAARLDEEQLAEHVEGQVQSEMTRGAALPGRGIPTAPAVAATPSPWGGLPAPWEKLPFWEAPSPDAQTAAAWPTAPQAQTPLQSAAPRPRSAAAPARLSSAPAASAAPQAQAASTSRSVDSSPPEMRGPAVATDHRKTNRKAPDLDRLAQQVYSLIKRRLSTEVRRDR
ncbi:eCIS core domain-containing protein [Deinococcus sp.]|uniref:eCIS core domain-containing protein n=1 Tax=Deinococcus sp. TaxID=47478 RepID=UPI003B5C10FD